MSDNGFVSGVDNAKDFDFTHVSYYIPKYIQKYNSSMYEKMGIILFGRNYQKSIKRKRIISKWKNRVKKKTKSKVNKIVFREMEYEINN